MPDSAYSPAHAPRLARRQCHRLVAIDGSLLRRPGNPAPGGHFGWRESGHETGPCRPRHVQARAGGCFDVLKRLGLDARREPFATGERALAALHAAALHAGLPAPELLARLTQRLRAFPVAGEAPTLQFFDSVARPV